jgi:hypothetical protein
MFAINAAQAALRAEGLDASQEAAAAHVAQHPELLRQAELTLRRSPVIRQLAAKWRAAVVEELRRNCEAKRRQNLPRGVVFTLDTPAAPPPPRLTLVPPPLPPVSPNYGVALGLARYRAKQIVKERWVAKGHRITEVQAKDVTGWAEAYMQSHLDELLEEARETIARSPELQRLVRRRARDSAKLTSDAQR